MDANMITRVAQILAQASAIFGSSEKALGWLRTPADERFDNQTALSMLQTESGARIVGDALAMHEGMLS